MAAANAEKTEASDSVPSAPKKKTGAGLWLIVALAVVVLLTAAGGAGLWWMNATPKVEAPVAKTASETPQFLKMDALTVSIRRPDGTVASFTVVISLDLKGGEGAATLARPQIPRLRDAFVQAMTVPALRAQPDNGRVSIDEVKARLLTASRAILGADAVRGILIEAVAG